MTRRRSRREIAAAVENLGGDRPNGGLAVVFEDPDTGDWFDGPLADDAEPVDEAAVADADPLVVIRREVVETDWEPSDQ